MKLVKVKGTRRPNKNEMAWFVDTCLFPYHYGYCPNAETWDWVTRRITGRNDSPYPQSAGCCSSFHKFEGCDNTSIVTINFNKFKDRSKIVLWGVVTHEALHVMKNIALSQNDDHPSEEWQACTIQRVAMDLMHEVGRHHKEYRL